MRAPSRRSHGRRRHLPKRGPWRCYLHLFLLLSMRALASSTGLTQPDLADMLDGRPVKLPPGHPECMVPHLPPTETERRLWAQLRGV